jgi:hypothetical protein
LLKQVQQFRSQSIAALGGKGMEGRQSQHVNHSGSAAECSEYRSHAKLQHSDSCDKAEIRVPPVRVARRNKNRSVERDPAELASRKVVGLVP